MDLSDIYPIFQLSKYLPGYYLPNMNSRIIKFSQFKSFIHSNPIWFMIGCVALALLFYKYHGKQVGIQEIFFKNQIVFPPYPWS